MIERLGLRLPDWARADHPLVRYGLRPGEGRTRKHRYLQIALTWAALVMLFWAGYAIATGFFQIVPGQNLTASAISILFWPTFGLQIFMQVVALVLTVNTVSEQKRRQSWDSLRATETGADLVLHTRWATVYYRLRLLLVLVLVIRSGLILGILYDLTAFQGRYIDLLVNNIVPGVSPLAGALLVAFQMTASLLLPLTGVGMEAALGLLISVYVQQRVYSVMTQIVVIVLRLLIVIVLLVAATEFIRGGLSVPDGSALTLMFAFGAFGDWGLMFLHLGFFSEVWATVPYSVFLGAALLIFAMFQSTVTEFILRRAVVRAERVG